MKWRTIVVTFCSLFAGRTAPAQIVYSGPRNIATEDYTVFTRFVTTGSPFVIDFNGDGIGEISIYEKASGSPGGGTEAGLIASLNLGAFAADSAGHVKPFQAGDTIGSTESWLAAPAETAPELSFNSHGVPVDIFTPFVSDSGPQFIGVQFAVDSEFYYGWIEYRSIYSYAYLSRYYLGPISYGYILGWAYETQPHTPIVAADLRPVPEPSTYGLAVVGLAVGVIIRRRIRRRSAPTRVS